VGLGIGATPFISIVKDIVNNMRLKDEESSELENGWKHKKKSFNTNHAYFYWVTREQGSFEWFKGVMNEVAEIDEKGIIELHNYCTSVYEEGDARSALITMLQSLNHAKHGVDIVSGTRVSNLSNTINKLLEWKINDLWEDQSLVFWLGIHRDTLWKTPV